MVSKKGNIASGTNYTERPQDKDVHNYCE